MHLRCIGPGLREADWKWNIVIRVGLKFEWHKLMPRHLAHGRHDTFVKGTLADCIAPRKSAGGDDREHVFTHGLKDFCSHLQLSRHTAVHLRTPSRATAPTGHPSRRSRGQCGPGSSNGTLSLMTRSGRRRSIEDTRGLQTGEKDCTFSTPVLEAEHAEIF